MVTLNESIEKRVSDEIVVALPPTNKKVLTSVENLINSGNKFRANLFYNTSKCLGYNNESDLLIISASLEILHRASLMHDDLADKSSTRRGTNTLHTSYGDTFAIYVPNLLRDHAEKMLVDYPLIQKELMSVYNEICRGQLFEIQIAGSNESTWEDYEKLVELKSAGLGRFALSTAYYLSHNEIDEENPREIAKTGALLFQLVDDLEDLLEVGYPIRFISTDIQNGIKTAPWFFLSQQEKAELELPDEMQKALTRPDILNKTYTTANKYLAQLVDKFNGWLPENIYRKKIIDDITYRFNERTSQYNEGIK